MDMSMVIPLLTVSVVLCAVTCMVAVRASAMRRDSCTVPVGRRNPYSRPQRR